jgi:hypothetical protein
MKYDVDPQHLDAGESRDRGLCSCEATTVLMIAGIAVAAASTGASLYAQSEQADAQADYQVKLAEARNKEISENYVLATNAYQMQVNSLNRRVDQEQERMASEEEKNAIRAAQARATVRTASGEAGVSGVSVNALLRDFMAQESRYREGLHRQNEFLREGIEDNKEAAKQTAQGRNVAIQPIIASPIAQPQYLAETLKLGSNIFGQVNAYQNQKPSQR